MPYRLSLIVPTPKRLTADGADEPFRDRVDPRRPHRRLGDRHPGRGEHRVEGLGEPGVTVADQEPEGPAGISQVHHQVACLLGHPRPGWVRGDPEDMHGTGGMLHDEQHIQPGQTDRIEVDYVTGKMPLAGRSGTAAHVGPDRRVAGSTPACLRIDHTVEAPRRYPSPSFRGSSILRLSSQVGWGALGGLGYDLDPIARTPRVRWQQSS
jgi:hypothetical protein